MNQTLHKFISTPNLHTHNATSSDETIKAFHRGRLKTFAPTPPCFPRIRPIISQFYHKKFRKRVTRPFHIPIKILNAEAFRRRRRASERFTRPSRLLSSLSEVFKQRVCKGASLRAQHIARKFHYCYVFSGDRATCHFA